MPTDESDPRKMMGLQFAQYLLMKVAQAPERFENEELARIVSFVMNDLPLRIDDQLHFIRKCGSDVYSTPEVLAKLMEDEVAYFTPLDLLSLLWDGVDEEYCSTDAKVHDKFLSRVNHGLEQGLFDLDLKETNEALLEFLLTLGGDQMFETRFFCMVGSHMRKKKHLGKLLEMHSLMSHFERYMDFLYDVISAPFFADLSGELSDFTGQFKSRKGYSNELMNYIKSRGEIDDEGNVIESDADSDGNLKGFVDDEDEEDEEDEDASSSGEIDDDSEGSTVVKVKNNKAMREDEEDEEEDSTDDSTDDSTNDSTDDDEENVRPTKKIRHL